MRLRALVLSDLSRARRRFLLLCVAVATSVAVVVLFGSLGFGVYRGVLAPLLPRLPLDLLMVEPRTLSVGLLAFDASALSGGLDEGAIDRLEKLEGVATVHPIVGASFPMHAEGGEGFLGKRLRTDVFATGLAPDLVAKDVARGERFEEKDGKVGVLVSRRLLDLYNSTVAPAIEKPRLSAEAVVGFEFSLVLGASYSRGTPNPGQVTNYVARIVGVSDQATLVGLTVPEATMRAWNERFGKKGPLTGAFVRTVAPSAAGPVARAIEEAGLKVDETPKVVGAALSIGGALGGLLALTLFILSGFGLAQTFSLMVAERRMELAILRALGARRADLLRLVLAEAAVVGLLGGIVGTLVGSGLALLVERLVLSRLPALPFLPEHLVWLSMPLLAAACALGMAASLLGALVPAMRAAAANPASALRA